MTGHDRTYASLATAAAGGLVAHWIMFSPIKVSCSFTFGYSDQISAESTSLLGAFAVTIAIFSFAFCLMGREAGDRFSKLITSALSVFTLLWFSYLIVDGKSLLSSCLAVLYRVACFSDDLGVARINRTRLAKIK